MKKRERINPDKTAYLYHADWMEASLELPDDLRLMVDDAFKKYCLYGEEPEDAFVKYSMFSLMKKIVDKDNESYENKRKAISEKRKKAGKLGGAPIGNENACKDNNETSKTTKNKQNKQNNPVTVTVPVTVPVSDELFELNDVSKREVVFRYKTDNGVNSIDWDGFKKAVVAFGGQYGISIDECERFYEYTLGNSILYADDKGENLYTGEGEVIDNWQGAFIRFSQTVYDRESWKKEHDIPLQSAGNLN